MNRLQLMKLHALLAAFVLPVALMFAVTGSLYTWGIKGSYTNDTYEVKLAAPLQADQSSLQSLAKAELAQLGLSEPEGQAKVKRAGDHFLLEWTGSSKDVILEPGSNPKVALLTIKHTTWYRNLVQLHKAKGGDVFKVYAAAFAVALGLLLVSGLVMALQTPKLKGATLATSALGVLSFLLVVWLS
ncbi:MAG: PepSY domain-containing protein [Pseudomonadales bacterium]